MGGPIAAFSISSLSSLTFYRSRFACEGARHWSWRWLPASVALFALGIAVRVFRPGGFLAAIRNFLCFISVRPVADRLMISLDAYLSFLFWMIIGFGTFFPASARRGGDCVVSGLDETIDVREHTGVSMLSMAIDGRGRFPHVPSPDVFSQLR